MSELLHPAAACCLDTITVLRISPMDHGDLLRECRNLLFAPTAPINILLAGRKRLEAQQMNPPPPSVHQPPAPPAAPHPPQAPSNSTASNSAPTSLPPLTTPAGASIPQNYTSQCSCEPDTDHPLCDFCYPGEKQSCVATQHLSLMNLGSAIVPGAMHADTDHGPGADAEDL